MAVAQMNVRMDKALKEGGDLALSQAGYTPTRAVQALWRFARDNIGDLGRIQDVLEGFQRSSEDEAFDETEAMPFEDEVAIRQLRTDFYRKTGIEEPAAFQLQDGESLEDVLQRQVEEDRALLGLTYEERNAERGL